VLDVIAEHPGRSTQEAAATAGEHATVLHEAGLIQTVRYRTTVRHSPTDLGIDLLGVS
jgi:hypothetical protein